MSGEVRIPYDFLDRVAPTLGLTATESMVYIALIRYADWTTGVTRRIPVSAKTAGEPEIARIARVSANTATRAIESLTRRGIVKISDKGVNRGHVYQITLPADLAPVPHDGGLSHPPRGTQEPRTEEPSPPSWGGTTPSWVPQSPIMGGVSVSSLSNSRDADDEKRFEEFWSLYPSHRRGVKKAVRIAWDDTPPPADVIARLRAYIPTVKDPQYVPKAEKWLREKRWELIKITAPSAEYLAWLETPDGQAHVARKAVGA